MTNWSHIERPTHDFGDGRVITYRSRWEMQYSWYLEWLKKNKEIKDWVYEPYPRYDFITYEFSDKEHKRPKVLGLGYLPDFLVTNNDDSWYLVEVKGRKQGMLKLKRMAKHYKDIKIELVDATAYNELKKRVGKLLNWK